MKRIAVVLGVLVVAALLLVTGCSLSLGRDEGAQVTAYTEAGALANGAGSTTRGAITDAEIGGLAGGIIAQQMDEQAKGLRRELPGVLVERVGEGIQVTFPAALLFALDSDDLTAVAHGYLKTFASSLAKYPRTTSLIVGHIDASGAGIHRMGLSERRAESAAAFLAELGVDRGRIRTVGRGWTEPLATSDSDAGRQQNRRMEVAIYADAALRRNALRRD